MSDQLFRPPPELVHPTEAAHVLWHYGPDVDGAREAQLEPGSFIASLIKTIARADPMNRARLYLGFPGYVAACALIENEPNGAAALVSVARGGWIDHKGGVHGR